MINNLTKIILFLFVFLNGFLAQTPSAIASVHENIEPIKIGSYLTPGLIKVDGTGIFNKLNKAIFNEINKNSELTISSLNRARIGIKKGTLDGYFPELWENLPKEKEQYIVSRPIFYKRVILFTLKGSGFTQLSDFKNELIGVVQGFSYGEKIKSNPLLNFSFQENDNINIKLLLNNRVSGVLGGYPGTVLAVEKSKESYKINYNLDKPVAVLESFYVCKSDPEGIKLCDSINKAILSLLNKGVLELNETTGFSKLNLN